MDLLRRLAFVLIICSHSALAQEKQPFYHHVSNLIEALDFAGTPLSTVDKEKLRQNIGANSEIQEAITILDKYVLFQVEINPESRVKVSQGAAKPMLLQNGWRTFLIKVTNLAGVTAPIEIQSEQSKRTYDGGEKLYGMGHDHSGHAVTEQNISDRWLDMELLNRPPMTDGLAGLQTEYKIVQLYSRDSGKRAAKFSFSCGQGTQDIGFRNEVSIFFDCTIAHPIKLNIKDEKGNPTMASMIIKDEQGHIYPSQVKRLAPDFFFQPQIYRYDGEFISLPPGTFTIDYSHGPEYISKRVSYNVSEDVNQILNLQLERWIDPTTSGWYSGDHHIHAAGCSHYTTPTEGVNPEDMMRHVQGEGVNVGCVLTWGPGYYHQKKFFEGKDNKLSTSENLLRYDLEISGFPSSHAGHLVLLRLKEQDYPNAKALEDWPTYTLPILRWAKAQHAVTGYAHSGLGLQVKNDSLPNYAMPRFDGIGANEYIVAVTHDLVDFISTIDTPPLWELNIWYHTLNCGFRSRISGETDFPCMSDDKVAHGRSYVKCEQPLTFDGWTEGLRLGKSYVSEGTSHIMNFSVNNVAVGTQDSEVNIGSPSVVNVKAQVAALLNQNEDASLTGFNIQEESWWTHKPFWSIERARIKGTRKVYVELVVNGIAVDKKAIEADGTIQDITFQINIKQSSWIALRILPSSHTNPIFVLVDKKPIRASRKSASWCLKAVDVCWQQKRRQISKSEMSQAQADYDHAREVYRKIVAQSR